MRYDVAELRTGIFSVTHFVFYFQLSNRVMFGPWQAWTLDQVYIEDIIWVGFVPFISCKFSYINPIALLQQHNFRQANNPLQPTTIS